MLMNLLQAFILPIFHIQEILTSLPSKSGARQINRNAAMLGNIKLIWKKAKNLF